MRELVDKARRGALRAEDMAGGTVTLSSTAGFLAGTWCVSTPLLNLPQVLNFQPGTPVERPCVVDGQIVVRTLLPCGLSFDHRATGGAPVGRLVRRLGDLLSLSQLGLLSRPRRPRA